MFWENRKKHIFELRDLKINGSRPTWDPDRYVASIRGQNDQMWAYFKLPIRTVGIEGVYRREHRYNSQTEVSKSEELIYVCPKSAEKLSECKFAGNGDFVFFVLWGDAP